MPCWLVRAKNRSKLRNARRVFTLWGHENVVVSHLMSRLIDDWRERHTQSGVDDCLGAALVDYAKFIG